MCYRPRRFAARVTCPMLVVVTDDDQSIPPGPTIKAAAAAPRAEVVRLPCGGHYASFLGQHDRAVAAELSFLERHLLR